MIPALLLVVAAAAAAPDAGSLRSGQAPARAVRLAETVYAAEAVSAGDRVSAADTLSAGDSVSAADTPGAPAGHGTRPIRTNEPGTGVFIGSGTLGRVIFDRESNDREELRTWTALADFRYTPSTHLVFGARLPFVLDRTLEFPGVGEVSTSGPGDLVLGAKYRFFRDVGRWSDRHAAVEVEVEVPTGADEEDVDPELPVERRHRLQPGSGSVDFVADLIYQEGRRRFVYGGDLSFRLNTEGEEAYRVGNELRLNLDLEYILFPLVYRRPGNEVFVLLETTLRRKWSDELGGRSLPWTARTDLLFAPAVQHIATEQLLFSLSVQVPAFSDPGEREDAEGLPGSGFGDALRFGGLEQDLNVLAELRYAF